MNETDDFISSFSREILQESGIVVEGSEIPKRLLEEVEQRIVARLFLEMVALLTPEQADRVAQNIHQDGANPAKFMESMAREIPEFHIHMAKALGELRGELVEDFKKLVGVLDSNSRFR